ncbi:MAG TPA: DUF6445 family protein [Caulobacterales bacterium]|nr:DUF6445 family protein [Caulobacterales bacterium]
MSYAISPKLQHAVVQAGAERQPILIIDNVLEDAEQLRAAAAAQPFSDVASGYYPGVRASAPTAYLELVRDRLGAIIATAFGASGGVDVKEGNFSLVTTPPSQLQFLQRMPHFDFPNPRRLAILHYLCGPECGGTAFFRHRRTGIEIVTPERAQILMNAVRQEAIEFGAPPAKYHEGDTQSFECLATVEARFNRIVVYRSAFLHSGVIPADYSFTSDPLRGRLTVNLFADLAAGPPSALFGGALSFSAR